MNDQEFLAIIGRLQQSAMDARKNEDYVINPVQLKKFQALVKCFYDACDGARYGTLDSVNLIPKEVHGGITASFSVFDLYGEQIPRFCDALRECSAFSIDVTNEDKVCISCTVPNVFVRRPSLILLH